MHTMRGQVVLLAAVGILAAAGCEAEPAADEATEEPVAQARPAGAEAPMDERQAIELPDSARWALRMAMVRMMTNLHGTAQALAVGDTARARETAAASGTGAPRMLAGVVGQRAPTEFMQMSIRNHQAFDRLARAASTAADPDSVIAGFAAVTGACLQCHQTYRVENVGARTPE